MNNLEFDAQMTAEDHARLARYQDLYGFVDAAIASITTALVIEPDNELYLVVICK